MAEHLFDDPDFVRFLTFWEEARDRAELPRWHQDMLARLPPALLPKLIVAEGASDPVYLYTGRDLIRRWGADQVGHRIFGETLTGRYAAYIRSLWNDALDRRLPIFSAAIFGGGDAEVILSGRLFAPFVVRDAAHPSVIMSIHLFRGAETLLSSLNPDALISETKRYLIISAPALCQRLAEASRWHRLASRSPQAEIAREMAALARELTGSALLPLPPFGAGD